MIIMPFLGTTVTLWHEQLDLSGTLCHTYLVSGWLIIMCMSLLDLHGLTFLSLKK